MHERHGRRIAAKTGPDGDDVRVELEQPIERGEVDAPEGVSSSDSVMYSGAMDATIGAHDRGVAMVTRPAPDRSAPIAARCAAPVRPREPATISTRPKSPLWESDARTGTISLIRSRVSSSRYGPSSSSMTGIRDADVSDDQIAGVGIGRWKDERNFWRGERDRHRGLDRDAVELCGVRGQAGRQIDGDNRHAQSR